MDHISPAARNAFEQVVLRTLRAHLGRGAADRVVVSPLPANAPSKNANEALLVLTISSFRFRMVVVFHQPASVENRQQYLQGVADSDFDEVFAEIGNLCCGAINRELAPYFPHLGMSTPYHLPAQCMDFLDALNPEYQMRHIATINDAVQLRITVCMCAYAPVDFTLDRAAEVTTTGELELF